MKRYLILFVSLVVLSSCNEDKTTGGSIFEAYEDDIHIDMEIKIITHGDTPVWFNRDVKEIEFLLESVDSISLESIVLDGVIFSSLESNKLISQFEMKKKKSESVDYSVFSTKNLEILMENGVLNTLKIFPSENLVISGIPACELSITDAKKKFPKSYMVRNFYGDFYRAKLYDLSFENYDHLVLKISYTDFFIHFRFIDSKLIDLEINKLRT